MSGGELSALTKQCHVVSAVKQGMMLFLENQSMGLASLHVTVAMNLKANVQHRALVPAFSAVLRSQNPISIQVLDVMTTDLGLIVNTTVICARGDITVLPSRKSYIPAHHMTVQGQHCPHF